MLTYIMSFGHNSRCIPSSSASLHQRAVLGRAEKNTNLLFSSVCALFVSVFTKERKSTPVFSCACAQFCEYRGVGANRKRKPPEFPARLCFGRQDCENLIVPPLNLEAAESVH